MEFEFFETPPADTILRYRPKARSEPARQRKRRKTILEKQQKAK